MSEPGLKLQNRHSFKIVPFKLAEHGAKLSSSNGRQVEESLIFLSSYPRRVSRGSGRWVGNLMQSTLAKRIEGGAEGGIRTLTGLLPTDFKNVAEGTT